MIINKIEIKNFRGIKEGKILVDKVNVFVGDNNSGKSTILEAIDLVMGPERLSKSPVINEHDFYSGKYYDNEISIEIFIEITLIKLNDEEKRHFCNFIEWWDGDNHSLINGPPPSRTDSDSVESALRVCFIGSYDKDEDDFVGNTYFSSTMKSQSNPQIFGKRDKRYCGFLYLRTLRTGNRALSLERGSLLDVIFQLKELRPQMWENIITQLQEVSIAAEPELGVSEVLTSVQNSLSSIVSIEDANMPHIRVSNLTRDHLRKILTVFMDSGTRTTDSDEYYSNPYYSQGSGTINMLVLALLTIIADLKHNVIFAMEEPEISLPPHLQKRSVINVISKSNQSLFTSHSPYVLEEFNPDNILVVSRINGIVKVVSAGLPPGVKAHHFRDNLKQRFCESYLSRKVLITEGYTEYDVYHTASKQIQSSLPNKQIAFGLLGISVINAKTDSQIAVLGKYFKKLNKQVYAIFDKQSECASQLINEAVDFCYEGSEHGIEREVVSQVSDEIIESYGIDLVESGAWPEHLKNVAPSTSRSIEQNRDSLLDYFMWGKSKGLLADFIASIPVEKLPRFIFDTIIDISENAKITQILTETIDGTSTNTSVEIDDHEDH